MTGTIPPAIGDLPRLTNLELQHNDFHGTLPQQMSNLGSLRFIQLAGNQFSGVLDALGQTRLVQATVNDNPGLCGMVPATVRYASGFSAYNTSLGRPCSNSIL
jgi:hypothetical protein